MTDMEEVRFWSGTRSSYEPMDDNRPTQLCICSRKRVCIGIAIATLVFAVTVIGLAVSLDKANSSSGAAVCPPVPAVPAVRNESTTVAPVTTAPVPAATTASTVAPVTTTPVPAVTITSTTETPGAPTQEPPMPPLLPISYTYRLPGEISPTSYKLNIDVNGLEDDKFLGWVEVTFQVLKITSTIIMHCGPSVNVTNWSIGVGEESSGFDPSLEMDRNAPSEMEQIGLRLSGTLKLEQGTNYTVKLNYEGVFASDLLGFYKSTSDVGDGTSQTIASTQFEPTYARRAFPCFDEPALKASFALSITHPASLKHVISNMPQSKQKGDADVVTTSFEPTPLMSTYLVAFVLTDKMVQVNSTYTRSGTGGTVEVSVLAPILPGQSVQLEYALKTTVSLLGVYEKYFDVIYPLPKLDLVAIPDFGAGAMENWGLITYRMANLLYDDSTAAAANQRRVTAVIAHELAHQWFGNLVSMQWWDDLWLNEGMATFIESTVGMAHIYNETAASWDMPSFFSYAVHQPAMFSDSFPEAQAIISIQSPNSPGEVEAMFSSITYNKGASLIQMLQQYITQPVLMKGLQLYIKDNAHKNTKTSDLWPYIQTAVEAAATSGASPSKVNISSLMDSWTKRSGYPLLSVAPSAANTLEVTQKQYFIGSDADSTTKIWNVPVTYTGSYTNGTTFAGPSGLVSSNTDTVVLPEGFDWVKLNAGQTGFYRVEYNQTLWEKIHTQMSLSSADQTIGVSDRAGLYDDTFNLLRSLHPDGVANFVGMYAHLANETEYAPLATAASHLQTLMLMTNDEGDELYKATQNFFMAVFEPYLTSLNFTADNNTFATLSAPERSVAGLLLFIGATFDCVPSPDLDSYLMNMSNSWLESEEAFPVDLRDAVYTYAVRNGDKTAWQKVLDKSQNSAASPSEKVSLLQALGKSKDLSLLDQTLKLSQNASVIKTQDVGLVIRAVIGNGQSGGKRLALWHVVTYYTSLAAKLKGFQWRSLIMQSFSHFYSELDVLRYVNYLESLEEQTTLGSAERTSKNVRYLLQGNDNFIRQQRVALTKALKEAAADV